MTSKITSLSEQQYARFRKAQGEASMEDVTFQTNFEYLGRTLKGWHDAVPEDDPRRAKLNDLMGAVNNLFIYTENKKITLAQAVALHREERNRYLKCKVDVKQLTREVELLKAEIETLNEFNNES